MSAAAHPDSTPQAVTQTLARLHTWIDEVPQPQRRLGKFIFLAAVIHFGCLFFIMIDNARPELTPTVRTDVTLDNSLSTTAEAPGEAYWDKLTDPRLYVLPQETPAEVPGVDATGVPFGPAAADLSPVPMPVPAEIGSFPFLNQPLPTLAERVNDSLEPARQPFTYQENPPSLAKKTTWQWDGTLAARGPSDINALPSPASDTEIDPTRLRVAITSEGVVSDVLLDETSQNTDLDQQAILAVQKVRFAPTGQPGTTWGEVTIAWYYTPKPKEVTPPPAPLAP